MTKYEFEQIVKRDKSRHSDHKEAVGHDWLLPLMLLEAEQDRRELIIFCGKLAKKLKEKQNALAS